MPDAWTLVTPGGSYGLNASFAAVAYQPGGVDGNAILRRDERLAPQRSGDGARTPGPLRLYGRVWNDAHDIGALRDELDDIIEAVAACVEVVRTTSVATYTYSSLAGGPPPEVTPDGLGGFEVRIELWPGRAAATYAPVGGLVVMSAAAVELFTWDSGSRTLNISMPGGAAPATALVILAIYSVGSIDAVPGFTQIGSDPLESRSGIDMRLYRRALAAPSTGFTVDVSNFAGITHTAVLLGEGLVTTDLAVVSVQNLDTVTALTVSGAATAGGRQLVIGDITGFSPF